MKKKSNLLIPIAGLGSRFLDKGYKIPKQLITAGNKQCIDWSIESFEYNAFNLIFIIREEHVYNFSLDEIIYNKYGKDVKIVKLKELTRGSVESCLYAEKYIDNALPLYIFTMDVMFLPKFNLNQIDKLNFDGFLLTFKSNSNKYSYVQIDNNGNATKTAEKETISDLALVGLYGFKRGDVFVRYAKKMIEENITTKNEFYIAPLYNLLIKDGLKIKTRSVDKMYLFGTPDELNYFENFILRSTKIGPVGLCSDHSGFELKEKTKKILNEMNIEIVDYGTYHNNDCDYNDHVNLAVNAFNKKIINKIFAFCRTGQGVNNCASKHKNIISALIYDYDSAKYAIEHNNANYFSFPQMIWNKEKDLNKLIKLIFKSTFDGARHQNRISNIIKGESHEI